MYHRKRSSEAINQMGILNKSKSTAMHDFFRPYLGYNSETGPAYFARIRSYISTAQKQNVSILATLENAFLGKPFIPSLNQAE